MANKPLGREIFQKVREGFENEKARKFQKVKSNFRARLEICSPDSFSVTPVPISGFAYPGEDRCFEILEDRLANVLSTHYTQNYGGRNACVYKLKDYEMVLRPLKLVLGTIVYIETSKGNR
ncbi:hypothetical protein LIER_26823 [Lithospermum erythrorhizon]|uniref:Uncharacterized protein n=1 Tax=Lithospermum erythrorhizon TaxID=34254 RepID=A0AAV3RDY7_LITER